MSFGAQRVDERPSRVRVVAMRMTGSPRERPVGGEASDHADEKRVALVELHRVVVRLRAAVGLTVAGLVRGRSRPDWTSEP